MLTDVYGDGQTVPESSIAATAPRLDLKLNRAGIHMAFVEMRSRLRDLVGRHGLDDTLDRDHFYETMGAALVAIREEDDSEAG